MYFSSQNNSINFSRPKVMPFDVEEEPTSMSNPNDFERVVAAFDDYYGYVELRNESNRRAVIGASLKQKGLLHNANFFDHLDNQLTCAIANRVGL